MSYKEEIIDEIDRELGKQCNIGNIKYDHIADCGVGYINIFSEDKIQRIRTFIIQFYESDVIVVDLFHRKFNYSMADPEFVEEMVGLLEKMVWFPILNWNTGAKLGGCAWIRALPALNFIDSSKSMLDCPWHESEFGGFIPCEIILDRNLKVAVHRTRLKRWLNPILRKFGFHIVSKFEEDNMKFLGYALRGSKDCPVLEFKKSTS